MSATGLSRRRVPAGSSSTTTSDDASESAWGSPAPSANGSASHTPTTSHAGSAFAGGGKVAYDPRDLERDDEDSRQGGKMPRLTIMEEVLLLGIKDKQVSTMILCETVAIKFGSHVARKRVLVDA